MLDPDRRLSRSVLERVAWAALLVLLSIVSFKGVSEQLGDRRLRGDQASHVFQAISLADWPPDLTFDQEDFAKWQSMGWTDGPDGLMFHREGSDLTAGKPYGYSLVASFFVRALGPATGMGAANVALFLANVAMIGWLLALRFRGAVLPLAIGAFTLASTLYLDIFIMQPELFMSALVGVVCIATVEGIRRDHTVLLAVAFFVGAWLVAERLPLVLLVAPPLAWVLWQIPSRSRRALLVGVGGVSLAVAILPYLITTGWTSVTAYGGNRFYLMPGADTWPPPDSLLLPAGAGAITTSGYVFNQLNPSNWGDIGRAITYTAIGRNTGMLVFMPMALLSFLAVVADRPWHRIGSQQFSWLIGLLLYVGFNVAILTSTFWGGGQTLGNKYVMQVLPVFVLLLVLSNVKLRVVTAAAAVAIFLAVAGMGPKLWHPGSSLWAVWQNTAFQDVLPYEYFALDPQIYPPQGDG